METLAEEAERHVTSGGERPALGIRINPDVAAGGHKHISTGKQHHKFGVDWETARRLYLAYTEILPGSRGAASALTSGRKSQPPRSSRAPGLERLASHFRELAANGRIQLETVDIGGGLGIRYTDEEPLDLADYARTLVCASPAASSVQICSSTLAAGSWARRASCSPRSST